MRFLALDFGAKRLGLALSDDDARFALPHDTYNRRVNDNRGDVEYLLSLMRAREVSALVLGVPSGSQQSDRTALQARNFAAKLQARALECGWNLEIHEHDERFSTSLAARGLRESGVSVRQARDGGLIDAGAAAAILQGFLDARLERANLDTRGDEPANCDLAFDDDRA